MNRTSRIAIAAAALCALAGLGALAFKPSARAHSAYTDGAAIRQPARDASLRLVLWTPAQPVAGSLNTAGDEYEPRISADGSIMVFVRGRAGRNAELYESRSTPTGWSVPEPIASINTPADELGPELSADGQWLYFYSDRAGGLGGYDLYRAPRAATASTDAAGPSAWDEPVNLGPAVNTPFNEYGPALTPEADRLYFSSNRPRPGEKVIEPEGWPATVREVRGRHDYDLFESTLTAQGAADARALTELNTADDEGAPAVSPVGDFLYFASDRAGGLGGFDLYRSRRGREPGAPPHGPAESAGPAVNSAANDLDPALSADGFRLTFSSDRSTDAPIAGQPSAPAPAYGLWWSGSREVYLRADPDAARLAWARALDRLWPWLLLLLTSLIGAWLLARFARRAGWNNPHGKLGLLARCLIFSFALHLVIASLLAVWRVGTTIGEMMREGGGAGRGTRVMLASSGAAEAIGSQIRGQLGPGPALEPTVEVDSRAAAPSLELALTPARFTPELATAADTARAPIVLTPSQEPAPADRPSPPEALAATPDVAASLPLAIAPSRPVDEAATPASGTSQIASTRAQLPLPALPTSTPRAFIADTPGPAAIDRAPPVQADLSAALTEPAISPAPRPTADGVPDAGSAPSTAIALPKEVAPAPSGTSGPSEPQPSAPLPAVSDVTAALAPRPGLGALPGPPARTSTRIDPAPATGGGDRAIAKLDAGVASASAVEPGNSAVAPITSSAPSLAGSAASSDLAIPSESPRPGNAASADSAPPTAAGTPGLASINTGRAGISTLPLASTAAPGRSTIAPGPSSTAAPAGPSLKLDIPGSSAPGESSSASSLRTPIPGNLPGGLAASPGGSGDPRLPEVPIEAPPAPVETFAQRDPEVRGEILEQMGGSRETERAVTLALRWLAAHQEPDGRWSSRGFDHRCNQCGGEAEIDSDAAITGMALLCYLGAGHTHLSEGEHRDTVARAIGWLITREAGRGDLRRGETMYAQTIASVALCEALAMTQDPRLTGPARRAAAFVLDSAARARNPAERRPDDVSVLGWQVMAVESARRCGFDVSPATFTSADRFLDRVALPASPGRYAHTPGGRPSAAMTAEAMFVRQLTGHGRDDASMQDSARYILQTPPRWNAGAPTYYWYYATLALFQQQGDAWTAWNQALAPELLNNQHQTGPAAGSWDPQDEWSRLGGRIYQTAVCTLSLEVYYRYRPAGMKPISAVETPPPAIPPARPRE